MKNIEAQELAKQIAKDQADWIDGVMRKMVPPSLHQFITAEGSDSKRLHPRLKAFLHSNRIQIAWIHDQGIPCPRIVVNGQPVCEWKLSLSIDGRPVDIDKVRSNAGVWVE